MTIGDRLQTIMRQPEAGQAGQIGAASLIAAVYGLAYLVFERTGLGAQGLRDLVGNVAFMPLNLAVVVLNALAARSPVLDEGVRRALRLFSLAALTVLIGNCISVWYLVVLDVKPPVTWADLFYLTDLFLILAAFLCFPLSRRISVERLKLALDATMVLIGAGVLIWYFAIRPATASDGDGLVITMLAFAYPLADVLVLLTIATVLLRGPLDGNRIAFGAVVGGTITAIVADLAFGIIMVETGERGAAWTDAMYLLAYLLLIASADLYRRHPVPRTWTARDQEPRLQPLSPLPYVAAMAVYVLLLVAAVNPWTDPVSGLAVGSVLATLVLMTRQFVAVRQNVRLLAETAVRANEARFRSLVQNSSDVIIVADRDGTVRYVSPSAFRVLRVDPSRLVERPLTELLDPEDRDRAESFFRDAVMAGGISAPVEWRFLQPDGASLHAEVVSTNLLGDPMVGGIVLNTRDVSDRKRFEEQLRHQAFHDPLTGLANRALFRDRVDHALKLARRQRQCITVLFLDLDDFKKVNDSFGHAEGDRLLVAAAERFRSCARAGDTVARLGGDEFAILIEEATGQEEQDILTGRLMDAMAQPFMLSGKEVSVTVSVGIASASAGDNVSDVLRNADVAMYTAKRAGKGRFESYRKQMTSDAARRVELERGLRHAIERHELVLYYQPIVELASGHVRGLEALVRWDHPQYGLLTPHQFVPLAEETGLITRIGGWVLLEACRETARWRREQPGRELTVHVNLSARELVERDVVQDVRAALAETRLDPSALVLEITEHVLMQQSAAVLDRLTALKILGVRLAIDDFGTGYSSLAYLQRFPIDILKIAKPFIEELGSGVDKAALARAIIGLGETLKLQTIAEGVERQEQVALLLEMGCLMGQGYQFAPPVAAVRMEEMLGVEGLRKTA
jgi:diguanylate cyclase (GGDEF)-like protein/PAS domain S-box-containing protein